MDGVDRERLEEGGAGGGEWEERWDCWRAEPRWG